MSLLYYIIAENGNLVSTFDTLIKFESDITKGHRVDFGFFHGMNGSRHTGGGKGITIIESHYKQFGRLQEMDVAFRTLKDHRKMLFFFEETEAVERDTRGRITLNSRTAESFIDKIRVGAVLIGSSNQSWNTYYAGGRGMADKGEADLFMISEREFAEGFARIVDRDRMLDDAFMSYSNVDFSGCVVFESMTREDVEEYFKNILRNVLENNLL